MKTLIYSFLGIDPLDDAKRRELTDMYDLWLNHLRGPGGYHGDIILFSNERGMDRPGVRVLPMETTPGGLHRFYRRVFHYAHVPARDYDVVLQTDLDILAVNDVTPLLERPAPFCAATSGLRLYDAHHVGNAGNFPLDFWRQYLPGQHNRLGVSASVFGCRAGDWEPCLSAWCRLIRQHQHKPLHYQDQTVLNLAYARQTFPITPYPAETIRHRDWKVSPETILLHFPTIDRLSVMRRHAMV